MGLVRFPGWRQVVPLSRQPQHEVAKPIRFIAEEYRLRCKVARRCHSVARRGPRARHSGPQDFQMNGTDEAVQPIFEMAPPLHLFAEER
jgi:hypothetical protein